VFILFTAVFKFICLVHDSVFVVMNIQEVCVQFFWFVIGLHLGGWWRWSLVNLDGVVPSQMVSVSASVNLPLHHEVQKFSSGTGSPWRSRK